MDNRAGDRTSLVRHEEKLTAAVQRVARGATRVRKRVITETVTVEDVTEESLVGPVDTEFQQADEPSDDPSDPSASDEARDPSDDASASGD